MMTSRERDIETLKEVARSAFSEGWARWELPSIVMAEARRTGVQITTSKAHAVALEAVPHVRF